MPNLMNAGDPITAQTTEVTGDSTARLKRRRLGQSPAREVHERFSTGSREQVRAARTYAEQWYQALREWRTFEGDEVLVSRGPARASRMRVVGIGNWAGSAGAFGSYKDSETMVSTPIGALTATRVALAITDQRSELLERVRAGRGPESLIHQNGRGWNGENAPAYAAAVLLLATSLGDTHPLKYLGMPEPRASI